MLKKPFAIGDTVRVVDHWDWPSTPVGIVSSVADPITTLQGEDYHYWVRFDPPARDGDGDGPYKSAQILSRYLEREEGVRHEVVDPGLEARTWAWVLKRLAPDPDEDREG